MCNNVVGSYSCSCTEGYELQSDNITCMGELVVEEYHNDCHSIIDHDYSQQLL